MKQNILINNKICKNIIYLCITYNLQVSINHNVSQMNKYILLTKIICVLLAALVIFIN